MRMRRRHNLEPRMESCSELMISSENAPKGHWLEEYKDFNKLYIELGCGKGRFTVETAESMPDTLFVAIEKERSAMIIAMERIRDRGLGNVRFIDGDCAKLKELFADGEADRIYINFCDPWPKSRDAKFRLTAPGFLRIYASVLKSGGEIHFKTDNTPLFDWSTQQISDEKWQINSLTHDLHKDGPVGVMTDYEAKFYAEGKNINRLVATMVPWEETEEIKVKSEE